MGGGMDDLNRALYLSAKSSVAVVADDERLTVRLAARDRVRRADDWIRSDGNCLFDSVADQLCLVAPLSTAEAKAAAFQPSQRPWLQGGCAENSARVRAVVVAWLRANKTYKAGGRGDAISEFVDGTTWEQYCENMARDRNWADHIVVMAVAQVFRRPIRIVQSVAGQDFVKDIPVDPLPRPQLQAHGHPTAAVNVDAAMQPAQGPVPCIELCHWHERHYGSIVPVDSLLIAQAQAARDALAYTHYGAARPARIEPSHESYFSSASTGHSAPRGSAAATGNATGSGADQKDPPSVGAGGGVSNAVKWSGVVGSARYAQFDELRPVMSSSLYDLPPAAKPNAQSPPPAAPETEPAAADETEGLDPDALCQGDCGKGPVLFCAECKWYMCNACAGQIHSSDEQSDHKCVKFDAAAIRATAARALSQSGVSADANGSEAFDAAALAADAKRHEVDAAKVKPAVLRHFNTLEGMAQVEPEALQRIERFHVLLWLALEDVSQMVMGVYHAPAPLPSKFVPPIGLLTVEAPAAVADDSDAEIAFIPSGAQAMAALSAPTRRLLTHISHRLEEQHSVLRGYGLSRPEQSELFTSAAAFWWADRQSVILAVGLPPDASLKTGAISMADTQNLSELIAAVSEASVGPRRLLSLKAGDIGTAATYPVELLISHKAGAVAGAVAGAPPPIRVNADLLAVCSSRVFHSWFVDLTHALEAETAAATAVADAKHQAAMAAAEAQPARAIERAAGGSGVAQELAALGMAPPAARRSDTAVWSVVAAQQPVAPVIAAVSGFGNPNPNQKPAEMRRAVAVTGVPVNRTAPKPKGKPAKPQGPAKWQWQWQWNGNAVADDEPENAKSADANDAGTGFAMADDKGKEKEMEKDADAEADGEFGPGAFGALNRARAKVHTHNKAAASTTADGAAAAAAAGSGTGASAVQYNVHALCVALRDERSTWRTFHALVRDDKVAAMLAVMHFTTHWPSAAAAAGASANGQPAAYVYGGAVRDLLVRGEVPADIDIRVVGDAKARDQFVAALSVWLADGRFVPTEPDVHAGATPFVRLLFHSAAAAAAVTLAAQREASVVAAVAIEEAWWVVVDVTATGDYVVDRTDLSCNNLRFTRDGFSLKTAVPGLTCSVVLQHIATMRFASLQADSPQQRRRVMKRVRRGWRQIELPPPPAEAVQPAARGKDRRK